MLDMSQIRTIRQMTADGESVTDIARKLGIDRKTVYRYLGEDDFSPKLPITKKRPSILDPPQTHDRWMARRG